ncbi:MAG: adenine deaminase [Suipraeoptans sp.]
MKKYKKLSEITRGIKKADLCLKNARIINVFTEEIITGDIAIKDGTIVGIGQYDGKENIDLCGRYVSPGFIDAHLHLESTLVTPPELVHTAAVSGTTTFIVDPHETANVAGLAGVDYILEQTENVYGNVFVMMPSCVPATDIDDNGAIIDARLMKPYLEHPRVLGLGEVMDCYKVVTGDSQMHKKLELFANMPIDGHAPGLSDKDLSAYVMAGIMTDHECTTYEYAMKQRRLGMTVHIREGSAAKNLDAIVSGIIKNRSSIDGFCFCTDDKHIEDIKREGHISYNVRRSIELGMNPVSAIKMATLNPAICYGLKHLGAIAPGYEASLIIYDNIEKVEINSVYYKGTQVIEEEEQEIKECPKELKDTIHVQDFNIEKLQLEIQDCYHVITIHDGEIITTDETLNIEDGKTWKDYDYIRKIAVIERHKNSGKVGVGFIRGFDISDGAIASSVSHDSHNIIAVGSSDSDIELAVNELIRVGGGYTIVKDGKVYETLELPIMGIMTDAGADNVNIKLERMIKKAQEMGVSKGIDPFITLSFMALPVIPEIRITPRGVYLANERKFV